MASSKYITTVFILVATAVFAGFPGLAVADSSASPVAAVNTTDGLALKGDDHRRIFHRWTADERRGPVQLSMEGLVP
jgi:hypothetical protein